PPLRKAEGQGQGRGLARSVGQHHRSVEPSICGFKLGCVATKEAATRPVDLAEPNLRGVTTAIDELHVNVAGSRARTRYQNPVSRGLVLRRTRAISRRARHRGEGGPYQNLAGRHSRLVATMLASVNGAVANSTRAATRCREQYQRDQDFH